MAEQPKNERLEVYVSAFVINESLPIKPEKLVKNAQRKKRRQRDLLKKLLYGCVPQEYEVQETRIRPGIVSSKVSYLSDMHSSVNS